MNHFGENLKLTVSGERHGPGILTVLDGLPSGVELNMTAAWRAVSRKLPGVSEMGGELPAGEPPAVMCGLRSDKTSGEPLALLFRSEEDQPAAARPRPGHEDIALIAKCGETDFSGGAYSGRLNTALAFVGALCIQILESAGAQVSASLVNIGGAAASELDFDMKKQLLDARGNGDSVGAVVECTVTGIPAGTGSPVFGGIESRIAAMLFSIPGVKGVEFGLGFGFASCRGSTVNDQISLRGGAPTAQSNNSGGADVGVTTGNPLVVRMALRPSPSVGREQKTVDLSTMQEVAVRRSGRREPCLGPRAIPVMEGAVALCLLDALLDSDNARITKEWLLNGI